MTAFTPSLALLFAYHTTVVAVAVAVADPLCPRILLTSPLSRLRARYRFTSFATKITEQTRCGDPKMNSRGQIAADDGMPERTLSNSHRTR
nr:hypothetical protein CFP56_16759 [Quercus suber]